MKGNDKVKLYLYSVKDKVANVYVEVMTAVNHLVARRNFYSAGTVPGSQIARFPNDFELYCVGSFENDTGVITALAVPELVAPSAINPDTLVKAVAGQTSVRE